jgi:hypothetical protein
MITDSYGSNVLVAECTDLEVLKFTGVITDAFHVKEKQT